MPNTPQHVVAKDNLGPSSFTKEALALRLAPMRTHKETSRNSAQKPTVPPFGKGVGAAPPFGILEVLL